MLCWAVCRTSGRDNRTYAHTQTHVPTLHRQTNIQASIHKPICSGRFDMFAFRRMTERNTAWHKHAHSNNNTMQTNEMNERASAQKRKKKIENNYRNLNMARVCFQSVFRSFVLGSSVDYARHSTCPLHVAFFYVSLHIGHGVIPTGAQFVYYVTFRLGVGGGGNMFFSSSCHRIQSTLSTEWCSFSPTLVIMLTSSCVCLCHVSNKRHSRCPSA